MPRRGTGRGPGLPHGDRSVQGDGSDKGSVPALQVPGPAAPTRRWEMTPQEQDMMARFRRDYLDLLDGRVAKIEDLVTRHEVEPAEIALLSLESSSAMVGAKELATAVRRLRSALSSATPEVLHDLTSQLVVSAREAALGLGERSR